jgi:predicted site-specific integrase-resolvase
MISKQPKQQLTRAAIYARVSSEQQTQQGTIESQIAALRQRVHDDGLLLEEELRLQWQHLGTASSGASA